jgi:RNA polymerase sigma-70 factor (ECF subfamily)
VEPTSSLRDGVRAPEGALSPSASAKPPASSSPAVAEFEALLGECIEKAFGMAMRLTRNRADAEDLVQEAALQAFRGFASFTPGTNFKAWFFKILMNCWYAGHRRAQHRPTTIDFDDTPDLYLYAQSLRVGMPHPVDDPASALLGKLDSEQVAAALEQLPEEYRVVATLYFMEDLSYQQIAEILNCPVGTVRSRLHRGRKMLQKALWKLAEESGIVRELSGDRDGELS